MEALKTKLSAVLAIQVALAVLIFWNHQGSDGETQQALFEIELSELNRILIKDAEASLTVAREQGQWRLPELSELPVNGTKLHSIFDKLNQFQADWPVATTASARDRFEVAEDKFQRRVQLFNGEQVVAEFYVGTSPGFRKVHLRRADDDEIYAVKMNAYDLSVSNADWLDKTLLRLDSVDSVQGPDFSLRKAAGDGEQWTFAVTAGSEVDAAVDGAAGDSSASELDNEKAKELVLALKDLQVLDVSEKPLDGEVIEFEVVSGERRWKYQFAAVDEHYLMKRDDRDVVFELSQYDFEKITKMRKEELAVDTSQSAETEVVEES